MSGGASAADPAGERARARIAAELERLAAVYAEPRVLGISVRACGRLRASLARARPDRAEVSIARRMLPSVHLEELVVHEVAHVVCWWRHGRTRPHGREWRALVSQAGHRPAVRLLPSDVSLPAARRRRRRRPPAVLRAAREFLRSLL